MTSLDITHFHVVNASNCSNTTNPLALPAQCIECKVEESGNLLALGICMGLVSSVLINVGQNIQALGAKEPGADVKPCTSKKWVIGLTIFIIGSLGNAVAMAFASATILVPLESSQFVTNVLFSKFINKCEVTRQQWLGTMLAVLGTVLTCVFGPNDDRCFTMDTMISFWTAPAWIAYLLATFALSGLGWFAYFRLRAAARGPRPPKIAEVGLPALFAVSSALIGGAQMIVHSKGLAELFDMLAAGGDLDFVGLLQTWLFWVEILICAVCGIFWAVQMNRSLTLYDPLFIIPLLQASYITFGSMGSGIFYQEFETLSKNGMVGAYAWLLYIGGVMLVVVGILLLAPPAAFAACAACCPCAGGGGTLKYHDVDKSTERAPSDDAMEEGSGGGKGGKSTAGRPPQSLLMVPTKGGASSESVYSNAVEEV